MKVSAVLSDGMRRLGDLPLFWKLLVPFLVLILLLGVVGAFFITRDLSSRAQARLNQDLLRHSLDARSILHDRELYLLESANFAANLQGVAEAIQNNNSGRATELLRSVLALKADLNLVALTNIEGTGLVEYARQGPDAELQQTSGTPFAGEGFVARALQDPTGGKSAGFLAFSEQTMLAIAAPVCSGTDECLPVGAAIVGIEIERLAGEAIRTIGAVPATRPGVAIYDRSGRLLATSGLSAKAKPPAGGGEELVRRKEKADRTELSTLYAPLTVQGSRAGTLVVSLRSEPVFSSVRGAGVRLALVFLAAMAGIVGIGALLSRAILAQVRALLETNRALGRGELSARAPVHGKDEIGELAEGVNQMAEQLEASYETLELRVAERTEEVRRLLRERTDFFASISHEFRTPLAVILKQAEMLLDPASRGDPKVSADSGRMIKGSASQLLLLINDILDLAEAERGRVDVQIEEVSLQDLAREIRPTIKGLADSAELTLALRISREVPRVRADSARLREILLNLLDNAVKYTPSGGRVEVSARENNGRIEVSVSDSGVGIPEEAKDRIFEPFFRVEGTVPRKGRYSTGLGLSLTKRLVEAQGGEIWFEDRPGGGTTFTFTLSPVRSSRPRWPRLKNGRVKQTANR